MPINSYAVYWQLQAVDTSGGTHPTGWSSGQFYSSTASQWHNMYDAEVTAYNAALAPASVDHISTSIAVPTGADGWTGNLTSITLDRTGQWFIMARCSAGGVASGVRITNAAGTPVGNNNGYFWHLDAGGAISGSPFSSDWLQGSFSSGTVYYIQAARSSSQGNTAYIDAYFIPTQANPH